MRTSDRLLSCPISGAHLIITLLLLLGLVDASRAGALGSLLQRTSVSLLQRTSVSLLQRTSVTSTATSTPTSTSTSSTRSLLRHQLPSPEAPQQPTQPRAPRTPRTPRQPSAPRSPPPPRTPRAPFQPRQPRSPRSPPPPLQPGQPRTPRAPSAPRSPANPRQPTASIIGVGRGTPRVPAVPRQPRQPYVPREPRSPLAPRMASPPPPPPAKVAGGGSTTLLTGGGCQDVQELYDTTNMYRTWHQAQPLAWDRALAQAAAEYAQSLAAADCSLSHSAGALAGRYGENTYSALLSVADSTCKTAVDIWYRESARYDFSAARPLAANSAAGVGHFTALVWRGTSSFGCGVGRSTMPLPGLPGVTAACKVVVCRYSGPGNVGTDDAFAANVKPKAASG